MDAQGSSSPRQLSSAARSSSSNSSSNSKVDDDHHHHHAETSSSRHDAAARSSARFLSPLASVLLSNVRREVYETSPRAFDEQREAFSGLDDVTRRSDISARLLERVEQVDMARDAVGSELARSVRESTHGLLTEMNKVLALDTDVTRTLLYVRQIRQTLASSKRSLHVAELRVAKRAHDRERLDQISDVTRILVRVNGLRLHCEDVVRNRDSLVSSRISAARHVLEEMSNEREFPRTLRAVNAVRLALTKHLEQFERDAGVLFRESFAGPEFHEAKFDDAVRSYVRLERTKLDVVKAVDDAAHHVFAQAISVADDDEKNLIGGDDGGNTRNQATSPRPFVRLANACGAFAQMLSAHALLNAMTLWGDDDKNDDDNHDPGEALRLKALRCLEPLAETYLKSAKVRQQSLDDFALTIADAARWMELLAGTFGGMSDANVKETYTRFEGFLRLRSCLYAQQYQVEGFQAMRGFLWRETWRNVVEESSQHEHQQQHQHQQQQQTFGEAIVERLGGTPLSHPPHKQFVYTTSTASGLPRQLHRTIDLLKKLPASAAGEAFLGLSRMIDLFLYTLVTTFIPKHRFLANKKASRSNAHGYVLAARGLLKEWLVDDTGEPNDYDDDGNSSNIIEEGDARAGDAHPQSDIVVEESVSTPTSTRWRRRHIQLCEFPFLDDLSLSYVHALVGAFSVEFVVALLGSVQKQLCDPLPLVERSNLTSKLFVDTVDALVVVQGYVLRSAAERLSGFVRFPDLSTLYNNRGDAADTSFLAVPLDGMRRVFREIHGAESRANFSGEVRNALWDETCAVFLEKYLNALARLKTCSATDRGFMGLHLATMCEGLNEISGTNATSPVNSKAAHAAKTKVEEFIRAYYLDKPADLWDWMKRKRDDYEPHHFAAIFETGLVGGPTATAGAGMNGNGGTSTMKREWKLEYDRIVAGM